MNWPSANDPFFLYNTSESLARKSYYSVLYVPSFRFDGKKIKDPYQFPTYDEYYGWMRHTLDSLTAIPSKIRINLSQARAEDTVHVSFDVVGADTSTYMNLFLAVVEERHDAILVDTTFIDTVGFNQIFRDMLPNTSGLGITPPLHDSLHFDWKYPAPLGQNDLYTVIFLQKGGSKVLFQAARAPVDIGTYVAARGAPLRVVLDPNAPNPFNPSTTIGFRLGEGGVVRLAVYDPAGRLVDELFRGHVEAGPHEVVWNGGDRAGRAAPSGLYFYRLETGGVSLAGRMLLLR